MAFLEYYPCQKGSMKRVPLSTLPFRIGRSVACQFAIASSEVSKEHAEIYLTDDHFRIRDLGSTNGTYINGYKVVDAPLADDDILHVANEEFRFLAAVRMEVEPNGFMTQPVATMVKESVARNTKYLEELIEQKAVRILFQPIVRLDDGSLMGYEALGRGTHSELSASPVELLNLAERCGLASVLSGLFRQVAVDDAGHLPEAHLFLNLHPSELQNEGFLAHLADMRNRLACERKLVLELHENVVCDFPAMRTLRQELKGLGILVAYDDYGAGQARFLELAEMPPEFVKLDMRLVRHIDQAEPRRNLIRALARVSLELGIQVTAEGVETAEEAEVCRELGCQFGQGYYFGLPKMAVSHQSRERTNSVNLAPLRAQLQGQP